jgi:putative ATP-dependent endonuclease of the OLD family
MEVRRLRIQNFRGVEKGEVFLVGNTLLVGGNNAGKSTVCEALDLVLGPERLYRRPVVDEHDFYCDRYLTPESKPIEIRVEALLVGLSDEARRKFGERHLRRWSEKARSFVDEGAEGPIAADKDGAVWALPVVFVGRYDAGEDDFEGNTFFAHPPAGDLVDEGDQEEEEKLGGGLSLFHRDHKRLCGFVFLRTLRTGTRALSLQRGSLLDTVLRLGGSGLNEMWRDTLDRLRGLQPPIGEIPQLEMIRREIHERMAKFVNLSGGKQGTAFFASELTRTHLREVVRFFLASRESGHLLPFQRLGTGTVNMLVFALLTFIAELKDKRSVIFAMEEPEIALSPHTQRRVARFVLGEMGQAIVTSHSPYVIEQFEPSQILMLDREAGTLIGRSIDLGSLKPKTFKTQRRQFAEAVLSRAVLVLEGSTEVSVFRAASDVMERSLGAEAYSHPDLAGVTLFDAGGCGDVPRYGPVFAGLGKMRFAFYDKPKKPWSADEQVKLAAYDETWESPYVSVEELLVTELGLAPMRAFLDEVRERADYPKVKAYDPQMKDEDVSDLCREVLNARKGDAHGYAGLLISHCEGADALPATIRTALESINSKVLPVASAVAPDGESEPAQDALPAAETVAPQEGPSPK